MLNAREHQILRAIVHEYLHSAQPVGSRVLRVRYGFGVSPATIRNVMAALTEAGFLEQPHVSAGRVPTDRAFRLFMESAPTKDPALSEQQKLTRRLEKAGSAPEATRKLAEQLSETAGAAGIHLDADGVQLFNLANVFGQPEFEDPRISSYLAELLDQVKDWFPKLAARTTRLGIRIGAEHEDFRARAVAILGLKLKPTKQYESRVGVIGSTRIPYQRLTALFDYGRKELDRVYG
jgi:transcriptional regulator of heat shock response